MTGESDLDCNAMLSSATVYDRHGKAYSSSDRYAVHGIEGSAPQVQEAHGVAPGPRAHFMAMAMPWMISADSGPTMWTPITCQHSSK